MEQKMDSTTNSAMAVSVSKNYKVKKRVGRGIPEINKAYIKQCSCRREKTIVFCRACGYYCNGRIRLKCDTHPRVSFLLDISECPKCHSPCFLDEHCSNV